MALFVRLWDVHVSRRRKRQSRELVRQLHYQKELVQPTNSAQIPEDKLMGFFLAAPIQAIAFWWFAWTIPPSGKHISPLASIAAIVPMGFAINEFDHVLTGYLVDTYTTIAGSACAPLAFMRAMFSAASPITGSAMFHEYDNNHAASVLAGLTTAYCGVAAWFYFKGKHMRANSRWVRAHSLVNEPQVTEKLDSKDIA